MHSTVAHPSIYLSPNSISLWLGTLCETHRQWYMVCKKKINFSNVFSYVNSLFTHYYICSARTVFFQHCIFPLKSKLNNELLVFSFGLFLVKNLFKNSLRRIFLASWLFLYHLFSLGRPLLLQALIISTSESACVYLT